MSVTHTDGAIRLAGACTVEDAEPLLALIQDNRGAPVDLSGCEHLHGAVLQILLAFRPPIVGVSPDAFTRDFVARALLEPAT